MTNEKTTTYLTSLSQAGLTYSQAEVYEILLKNGPLKAGKIHQKTDLKRGLVYKMLDELVALGLVKKNQSLGKVDVFEPEHPTKLKDLAEKQEAKAKTAQTVLDGLMPKMVSDFNLVSGIPGIQFYEGLAGAKKVLEDSLTAITEIYSYIDNEAVSKYYPEIDAEYVGQRRKQAIRKKMIMIDSEYTRRNEKNSEMTEIRIIPSKTSFATVMQIYNDKVSYITVSPDKNKLLSIIIQQPDIAKMHKSLFEHEWSLAKPLPRLTGLPQSSVSPT